ncbi:hypothetical protein HOY80DRAFT_1000753 [Tuber brumale]|nr:hypothetical protein HOY80DRAFT_1000753 [Tuber brumale]
MTRFYARLLSFYVATVLIATSITTPRKWLPLADQDRYQESLEVLQAQLEELQLENQGLQLNAIRLRADLDYANTTTNLLQRNPDDNYKVIVFDPDMDGMDGRVLDPV